MGSKSFGKNGRDCFLVGRIVAWYCRCSIGKEKAKDKWHSGGVRNRWRLGHSPGPMGGQEKCGSGQPPKPHLLVGCSACFFHRAKAMRLRSPDPSRRDIVLSRSCESGIRSE